MGTYTKAYKVQIPLHNTCSVLRNSYAHTGWLIAMSINQEGPGPCALLLGCMTTHVVRICKWLEYWCTLARHTRVLKTGMQKFYKYNSSEKLWLSIDLMVYTAATLLHKKSSLLPTLKFTHTSTYYPNWSNSKPPTSLIDPAPCSLQYTHVRQWTWQSNS